MKAPPKLANRLRGRVNKIRGDQAELLVAYHLHRLGLLAISRHETGWRVKRAGGKIIGATPMGKVPGDFRAVVPGGRSVLVEVKRCASLTLSAFQPHSRKALEAHATAGGLSLVAWVKPGQGVAFMVWGSIVPGMSVPWVLAECCSKIVQEAVANRIRATFVRDDGTDTFTSAGTYPPPEAKP